MNSPSEAAHGMQQPEAKPGPVDVHFLRRLWIRLRLPGRLALVGFVTALMIALVLPNEYQSTVQIMPPDMNSLSGVDTWALLAGARTPVPATGGLASSLMKSAGATFLGILKSRTVADALIDRFDLRRAYGTKRFIDARAELASRTSAVEDPRSGILSVTVVDRDPGRSRDLAAAYVEELNKLVAQLSSSSARRERVFLEARLKQVKDELDTAAVNLSRFSSRNATLDIEHQGRAMLDATARLQGELIVARGELRSLEAIYADDNVRVRSLKARVLELQRQLQSMGGSTHESEANLPATQLYPSVRKLPLLGLTYTDLLRRVKLEESVFEILTKQYEAAKVQEAKEIPAVKVLDAPDLPERKSSPRRMLITLSGLLAGLACGGLWVAGPALWARIAQDDGD
jgi:capsule polysaccharide export protein KpsE/RkpR